MTLQNCPKFTLLWQVFLHQEFSYLLIVVFFKLVLEMRSLSLPLVLKSEKPCLNSGSHLSTWPGHHSSTNLNYTWCYSKEQIITVLLTVMLKTQKALVWWISVWWDYGYQCEWFSPTGTKIAPGHWRCQYTGCHPKQPSFTPLKFSERYLPIHICPHMLYRQHTWMNINVLTLLLKTGNTVWLKLMRQIQQETIWTHVSFGGQLHSHTGP